MKTQKILPVLLFIISLCTLTHSAYATNYTWNGSKDTLWTNSSNWSPAGTPGSNDSVTIVSATYNPVLSANQTVYKFTMTSGTFNLKGYTFTISTGAGTFNGGTINNGALSLRGSLADYAGTTFGATIDAIVGANKFNGSTFNSTCTFENTGNGDVAGSGGNTFNGNVTIYKSAHGDGIWHTSSSNLNTFNGTLTVTNNGTGEIQFSESGSNAYNGNITVNCINTGGIYFGKSSGGTSTLAASKNIAIGASGYNKGTLLLRDFKQTAGAATTLTLTGSAIMNFVNDTLNAPFNTTAPNILLKGNVFNDSCSLTHTSGSANSYSDGGNTFNAYTALTTTAIGGLRLGVTTSDYFNGNVVFTGYAGTNTRGVQIGYATEVFFKKNLTCYGTCNFLASAYRLATFTGNNAQQIYSDSVIELGSVKINKSENDVTLNTRLQVDGVLTFMKGRIISGSTNMVYIYSGASVSGASDSSFVFGPVKKKGNTSFVFPIGKDNVYRALEMSAPSASTDAFTAEYFNTQQQLGSKIDTIIGQINECAYWNLARNTGSSNVAVTLHFDSADCGVLDSANLRVAVWNDTIWADKDKGTFTGNTYRGTISSNGSLNKLGPIIIIIKNPPINVACSLATARSLPPHLYGLNGASLINNDTWATLASNVYGNGIFDNEPYSVLRYPGGTVANYWGWEIGYLYSQKNMPAAVTLQNNFIKDPIAGDGMDDFKKSIDLLTGDVVLDFNIMTSNLHDQLGMIYNARSFSLPTTSVELGNEFYLSDKNYQAVFESATLYAKKANIWATEVKNLSNGYSPQVAIVGAWAKPIDTGRRRLWLNKLLAALPANTGVDAITIHQYIGNSFPNLANPCLGISSDFERMMSGAFQNMNELENQELAVIKAAQVNKNLNAWITEFNLVDNNSPVPGRWAHGLYDAARSLAYLEDDRITKILLHDIVEDDISSPVFFNDAADNVGTWFNKNNCASTTGTPIAGQRTATGNAFGTVAEVARNADEAQRICFTNVGVLDTTSYPEVYGWKFIKHVGGDVYRDYAIILNMSGYTNYNVNLSTVFLGFTVDIKAMYDPEKLILPRSYVTDDAGTNATNGILLASDNNWPTANSYKLRPWSITHIVASYPHLCLTSTVSELCTGSTTAIRLENPNSNATYSWAISSGTATISVLNNVCTFIAPATVASATPYTVTLTQTLAGATSTATQLITVYQGFYVTASSTNKTCTGADLTGTVTGGSGVGTVSYKWVPSGGLATPSAINTAAAPDSSTNYWLMVSDGHCAARSNVAHVSRLAPPDLGPDLKVCDPLSSLTISLLNNNYGTGTSYLWNTTATTTTLTVTGLTAGSYVYTLSVYSGGCSNTSQINVKVENCCLPAGGSSASNNVIWPHSDSNLDNNYVSTTLQLSNKLANFNGSNGTCLIAGSGNFPDIYDPTVNPFNATTNPTGCPNMIYLNGKLRINQGIEIRNCDVVMGEASEIFSNMSGGNTRTIAFNTCSLYTCGSSFMWNGMKINNDNHKIIITNCTVNDAELAVDIEDDAEFLIENSNFNRNRVHIRIADTKNATQPDIPKNGGTIYNRINIIAGNNFDCDGVLNVNSPTAYTNKAIELYNVVDLQIGHETYTTNNFTNSNIGIYAYKSSATIMNNTFSITPPVGIVGGYPAGSSIFAWSAYDDNDRLLKVGTNIDLTNYGNTFANSTFGITTRSEISTQIAHNTFNAGIERYSIQTTLNTDKTSNINNNDFNDFHTGVLVLGAANQAKVNIYENNFTTGIIDPSTAFGATAITVQNYTPQSPAVAIYSNNITDARIGLHVNNIQGAIIGGYLNSIPVGNNIYFNVDDGSALTDFYTAIWAQNSSSATIKENHIENNDPATSNADKLRGIAADNSNDLNICGNTLDDMGYAMRFEGDCQTTTLKNNVMTEYNEGVVFENAKFSLQGAPLPLPDGSGWDNQWVHSDPTNHLKVDGSLNLPGPIIWYHQGADNSSNPYSPKPFFPGLVLPMSGAASSSIDCETALRSINDFNRDIVFGPVVGDSASYNYYTEEATYLAIADLFLRLKENPELLNIGSDADESFADFYESILATNVGKFDSVNNFLSTKDLATADAVNRNITDANNIETNNKTVNDLVINKIAVDSILNSTDTATLENIFTQHWLTGEIAYILQQQSCSKNIIRPQFLTGKHNLHNNCKYYLQKKFKILWYFRIRQRINCLCEK